MSVKGFEINGAVEKYDYNELDNKPDSISVDDALSSNSINPVQNRVVTEAINEKYTKPSGGIPASDLAPGTIPSGLIVDSALSTTSENPVQNKLITNALNDKAPLADVSKNLIIRPYSRASGTTSNGVTFTVNSDGTVTANGTATANATFVLRGWSKADGSLPINPRITYRLTGSPAGASTSTFFIACRTYTATQTPGSTTGTVRRDTGNGVTWTGASYVSVYVAVISGQTVNNLVFSPMLTYDGVDETYDEYGESVIPYLAQSVNDKLSADQGVANAGKILVVGDDGIVVPESLQSASGVSF